MRVIKRDGSEVAFNKQKIRAAIMKAMAEVPEECKIPEEAVDDIVTDIEDRCAEIGHTPAVEEIQDLVEEDLVDYGAYELAKQYIIYRYNRAIVRQGNTTDARILSLIEHKNEEIIQENSNKNSMLNSTQRDYIAGEVSKDITKRLLLPPDIQKAHDEGLIHFHDADYFVQRMSNCCLVNLEDMLQNGTVISETMIERPHSFYTACNIATQIIAQIASNQYGGQSISLAHLAPFVDVSRKHLLEDVRAEFAEASLPLDEEKIATVAERRLLDEIRRGVQTIQYQILTLLTTNGQTPFVTVYMYLNEAKNETEKFDLALIIEEVLNQRYQGVKNEVGVWITPAFPKLIYVLEEDNIHEGDPYYYLTKLAAKCTAKRMVPDYISEKMMLSLKGDTYPCMGCVDGKEVVTYRFKNAEYTESFERMWSRLSNYYNVELQPDGTNFMMKTPGVEIYDQKNGFVDNYGVIKNKAQHWLRITFSNGRILTCTTDHPFTTNDGRLVLAKNLTQDDIVDIDTESKIETAQALHMKPCRAWLYGFTLCDATYYDHVTASVAANGEEGIVKMFCDTIKNEYHLDVKIQSQHRGAKGEYIDLSVASDNGNDLIDLKNKFVVAFEGKAKNNRHIPNEVFAWDKEAKLSFLAGMIDADGYLNTKRKIAKIQIGSTNKELAIQQALLAQSCDMKASIYKNVYKYNACNHIRYRVEFVPTDELLSYVKCEKKRDLGQSILDKTNHSLADTNVCHVIKKEVINREGYSYDVTTASEHFTVSGIYSHNCRSFLTPDKSGNSFGNVARAKNYDKDAHKYYGRFNQGVVTINLPDVALSSGGDVQKFWQILDERLELCHRALLERHNRLKGTPSDVAPILWQYGALARLDKGETIDKLLYNGYSTISLGYAGLYECVKYMTGKSHTDPAGKPFALEVMNALNAACKRWKEMHNIDFSLYGTPLESTTYKFAKCLQKRFGVVPGITDKNYINNSYHISITEPINAFDKLAFEAEFQHLSPGGAISYVEVPDMQNNLDAVLEVMKFIYDHIIYAELNTKSDYCHICGWDGEINIVEEDGKLIWKCPNCGNTDQDKMNVARRTCGRN